MDTPPPGWWTTLRRGDLVILASPGYAGWRAISHVERLTKARLFVANPRQGGPAYGFYLKNGYEIGGQPFRRLSLQPYTAEAAAGIRQEHAHAQLLARFQKITAKDLGGLTVEQCEGLTACLTTHGLPAPAQ